MIASWRRVVLRWSLCMLPAIAPAALASAAEPNALTAEELADGWVLLFDGETLFGWRA